MNIEKCNILWSFAFWSSAKLSWIINNITRMHTTSPYPPKWFCRTDHLFMCFFLVIVLLWFSYRALIVQKNEDLRRNLDLVQEISALFRCGKRLVIHQNESYDLLSLLALLLSGGSFSHLTPFNNLCCSGQNVFSALVVHTIFMVPLQVSSGFYLFFFFSTDPVHENAVWLFSFFSMKNVQRGRHDDGIQLLTLEWLLLLSCGPMLLLFLTVLFKVWLYKYLHHISSIQ